MIIFGTAAGLAPEVDRCNAPRMYKNIVVGTDGSETAGLAVHHAIMLAKMSGAKLHIVHAYQVVTLGMAAMSASSGGPMIDAERLNSSLSESGAAVCSQATATAERGGVEVEAHSMCSDPADALINVAQQVDADLLVVGNRGMAGVKRFMLGSVPNRISHHSPCSLLIVNTTA